MADMYTDLAISRNYTYSVARAMDKGHKNRKDCSAVILRAGELATQMALQAIQCLGKYIHSKFISRSSSSNCLV